MKILITTGIYPPDIGGPATQIEYLASDLTKNGLEVEVLTYGNPEKKSRLFRLANVSKTWPAGLRHVIFGLKTFLMAYSADIIYTTDLYSPGFYSMLASKFWRKKFVVRFAGDSAWETAFNRGLIKDDIIMFQKKIYGSFIEKMKARRKKILESADAIIAVSNFIRDLAIQIGILPSKIHVIYNAVDFFGSLSPHKEPTVPTLVFSGRLTPWKGVEMLIKIIVGLKKKYPNVIFEVLGEGSETAKLKDLARRLDTPKNINFRGKVGENESRIIFSHSTIFVLNTAYEGLSHAVLNAMDAGIPVITTFAGGNPEVIENGINGFLVPYNDEKAWLEAITKLLEDGKLRAKFSRNAKITLEKFKWNKLVEKTIKVLENL
ncbi:MAG: glycosyltransferase family 4 protein [Candidatus Tagabacteria bacterium]